MNKRIIIFANNDVGLYRFRKELIQELVKRKYKVYIALPDGEYIKDLKKFGCKFINTKMERRGKNPLKDAALFLLYINIITRVKPALVITYTIKPNIYGAIAAQVKKVPYVVNITGLGTAFQENNMLKNIVVKMYKLALRKAKMVFFENGDNRDTFTKSGIINVEKCHVLNGAGVNIRDFPYAPYPKNNDKVHFLFMGRVMKEKGIEELFYAMKKLVGEGENCVLDVLGDYEENYEEQITNYRKEGWLNYYGFQKDVRPFIEKCHCFVLPSWHEGMANTNLESASMGRPIITSNIPGCREAIIPDETGLYCEPRDSESLYQCMKYFCNMSLSEREQMGLNGRKHIETVFSKDKVVSETVMHLNL